MNISIKLLIFILLLTFSGVVSAHTEKDTLSPGTIGMFTENVGQWDNPSLFCCPLGGATIWLEPDRFTFLLEHPDNITRSHRHSEPHNRNNRYRTHAYQMVFVNAEAEALQGFTYHQNGDYENYFLGNDRSRWKGHVGRYNEVEYRTLYEGIDLQVLATDGGLKYNLYLHPSADPTQIRLRYEGVDGLRLRNGDLMVKTSVGDVVEAKPYAYQKMDGEKKPVEVAYILKGDEITFRIGDYDTSKSLVIDPELIFSTYTGSPVDNWGTTAAYDQQKNVYTAGLVFGHNYPVSLGAYDGIFNGNADVGIFVFDPSGGQRIYATYLGGNRADMPHTMVVNDLGELVIFGTTGSYNFPVTPNAYDTTFHGGSYIDYESNAISYPYGSDLFVCRFSADGSQLAASTFVGGTLNDGLNYENYYNNSLNLSMLGNDSLYANYGDGARGELICDDLANIYVGTTTHSSDFPVTPNSFRTTHGGGQDGVVFKLDYNLQNLLWSGFLGGSQDDAVYSIDVDRQYNLLVCGGTCSRDMPTTNGVVHRVFQGGTVDGFVAKIDYFGRTLMACSYVGSPYPDQCYFVRCGKEDDVFLFGQTKATGTLMVHNATYYNSNSGQFLQRLSPNLDTLRWSTVFGSGRGTPDISPTAFAADICDRVYAVGWGRYFCGYNLTGNHNFFGNIGTTGLPVTDNAYQSQTDAQDFYIFSMDNQATTQLYGSFFGEMHTDGFYGGHDHVDGGTSRFDRLATLYQSVCASCGGTSGFPTTAGAWSATNEASNCNNAVFRFNVASDFPVADFPGSPSVCASSDTPLLFPFTGRGDSVTWYYGDGSSDHGRPEDHAGAHSYQHPGIYTVTLVTYMDTGCRATDTLTRRLLVMGDTCYRLDTLRTCANTPIQIGLPPAPHTTYEWIEGRVSDPYISNPYTSRSGNYTMVMQSLSGCVDTVRQTVLYGQTNLALLGDTLSCSSPATFSTTMNRSGCTYRWYYSHDPSSTLGNDPELSIELFHPVTLCCQVVDLAGCEGTDSIRVRFYRVMDTIHLTQPPCPATCEGQAAVLTTSLATPPLSYFLNGTPSPDSLFRQLCPGSHSATLIDANGCRVEKSFTLTEPPEPLISARIDNLRCFDDSSGAISLSVNGHASPYTVLWDDGSTDFHRAHLSPGTYQATIFDTLGCQFVRNYQVINAENHFADISVWADDTILFLGESTRLHAEGCPSCTFLWSPSDLLDDPSLPSPLATPLDTVTFRVLLHDSALCQYTDSVKVYCIWLDCATSTLFIPNAFTPNGDGLNDQLCFRHEYLTSFDFRLFSRWGEEVFSTLDPDHCWDGTYKGQACPPGVYTYYCTINCEGGQESTFKGDITLIR